MTNISGEGPSVTDSDLGCFVSNDSSMTDCVVDGVFSAGPTPTLMGLLLSGTLLTSLYIAGNGDVIVPSVVTILFGAVMVPVLPAQYVGLAYTVVAVGMTVAGFAVWSRFTSRGGFQ